MTIGDEYKDFSHDMHLTNYQRLSGEELLAEKKMKEKRNHGKKAELPRYLIFPNSCVFFLLN